MTSDVDSLMALIERISTMQQHASVMRDRIDQATDAVRRYLESSEMRLSHAASDAPHEWLMALAGGLTLLLSVALPAPELQAADCQPSSAAVSRQPVIGALAAGQKLDPTLLADQAVTAARRAGYADYLRFRPVELPATAANFAHYCADTQRDRVQMFWLRPDCTAVVVSNRADGIIGALYRDCAAALVQSRQTASSADPSLTPGARLALGVREHFGDPLERLQRPPESRREATPSSLLGLR